VLCVIHPQHCASQLRMASALLCAGGRLNLSDLPETMAGARPRATPARRREFEQQSLLLHDEDIEHRQGSGPTDAGIDGTELEGMFPTLDASLIRTLLAEAASAQQVIDTLLSLASAATTQDVHLAEGTFPMKPSVQDHSEFPLLISSDGWQVLPARFDLEDDSIGTGWRDLAKSIAERPAPKCSPPARAPRSKKVKGRRDEADESQELGLPTEYDYRHLAGERRVNKKKLYGRGSLQATTAAVVHSEEVDEVLKLEEV